MLRSIQYAPGFSPRQAGRDGMRALDRQSWLGKTAAQRFSSNSASKRKVLVVANWAIYKRKRSKTRKKKGYRDAHLGALRDWEGHLSCTFPVKQAQFHFLKPRLWDGSDVEADYPDQQADQESRLAAYQRRLLDPKWHMLDGLALCAANLSLAYCCGLRIKKKKKEGRALRIQAHVDF